MSCMPAIPASCVLGSLGDAAGSAVTSTLNNGFADAMRDGAQWVIHTTVGWWIDVPPIDLVTSPAPTIRGYVLWLAMVVATGGIIWQGILLTVSRRSSHLLDVGRGLFVFALWSAIGIVGPAAALRAGDAFSAWVLDEASGGRAADRLTQLAGLQTVNSAGAVIVLGLVLMVAGLAQAVMMMFREGAIVILAGVVVLAAAGQFVRGTRPWLPKVIGWMLALICFKPAAALVYATALALVGEGDDPRTVLVGLAMLVMAVFALPALMKFFTWATGTAAHGGGGGMAAVAGASAAALHAKASMSSGSRSAADQASHIRQDLGPLAGRAPTGAVPAMAASGATSAAASAFAGPVGVAVTGARLGASAAKSAGNTAGTAMSGETQ
jgi:hypothetical protein